MRKIWCIPCLPFISFGYKSLPIQQEQTMVVQYFVTKPHFVNRLDSSAVGADEAQVDY